MKALLIAIAIAHGADAASTAAAIRAGAREAHPWLPQSISRNVAAQGGLTAAQVWGLHYLAKGKPRLARVLGLVAFGIEAGATGYNVRVTLDARGRP